MDTDNTYSSPEKQPVRRSTRQINGEGVALLLLVSLVTFLYLLPSILPGEQRGR